MKYSSMETALFMLKHALNFWFLGQNYKKNENIATITSLDFTEAFVKIS